MSSKPSRDQQEKQVLRDWARLAPSTFQKLTTWQSLSVDEQRATLEGWVAWLNSKGAADPATIEFRNELTQLLERFNEDRKGSIDPVHLKESVGRWLETAGEVGGPEQEQDPTLPHAQLWHGSKHRNGAGEQ